MKTCAWTPKGGPQALVSRFVEHRQTLGNSGFEEIVFQSTVYAPNDLPGHRPKSEDECHMDLAALYTECNDYDSALAALNSCRHSDKGGTGTRRPAASTPTGRVTTRARMPSRTGLPLQNMPISSSSAQPSNIRRASKFTYTALETATATLRVNCPQRPKLLLNACCASATCPKRPWTPYELRT